MLSEISPKASAAIDRGLRAHQERFAAWAPRDRHGRWVVVERGAGRLLRAGTPRRLREIVDEHSTRRGRRFASLSRARAFARRFGGAVRRFRRAEWATVGPWTYALHSLGVL